MKGVTILLITLAAAAISVPAAATYGTSAIYQNVFIK